MSRGAQIGVVEESEDNRALIVELLRAENLEVVAFERVDDLIARGNEAPAIAVCDAWTVWRREGDLCALIPLRGLLVLTTAYVHESVWHALGAPRIMSKPFGTRDFVASVRALASQASR